ncbi:MAG: hypothetical protein GY910_13345, partial [bacterium]|nr:hypothetical protein [bacterium]
MKGPATLTQHSQWMQERAHPRDPGNTIPFLVRFRKEVQWSELNAALTALVEVHPALRTAVRLDSSESAAEPIQIVLPPPRRVGFGVRSVIDLEQHSLSPIIDGLMQ